MKINEFYSKPLDEAVKEMPLANVRVYSDVEGNVTTVDVRYGEKSRRIEKPSRKPIGNKENHRSYEKPYDRGYEKND